MADPIQSRPHDHLLSVIVLGDQSVGKTSLILSFIGQKFSDAYNVSVGIDFKCKKIEAAGRLVKLQIWDTAGQERFRTISQTYYQKADAVIIAYDCSSGESFNNLSSWVTQIKEHCKENVVKVIAATKCDVDQRAIPREKGEEFARQVGLHHFETSAKANTGVQELFTNATAQIITTRGDSLPLTSAPKQKPAEALVAKQF